MSQKNSSFISRALRVLATDKSIVNDVRKRQFMLVAQAIYGVLWLEGAYWKITIEGKFALNYDGLAYWVSKGSEFPVFAPYKWLIDNAILPNIEIFLIVVFLSELTIGALFVTGKYVRVAAIIAVGQTLAIMLSVLNAPHEWIWSYLLMLLVGAIFFVNPTISAWPHRLMRRK